MINIENLYAYLNQCELLKGGKLNADFLSEEEKAYTLELQPEVTLVKRYIDGSSVQKCTVLIKSQNEYSVETLKQPSFFAFAEEVARWMEQQNKTKNFPLFTQGEKARSWEVRQKSQPVSDETNKAHYQIECNLEYDKEELKQ